MLHFFDVFILSIIEGLTEFLPISSTGHLIIANHFLNLTTTDFLSTFEIFIQLGAVGAVAVLFWRKLIVDRKLGLKIILAFLPTALVGLTLYPIIKGVLLKSDLVVVLSLFVGGLILILFEWWYQRKESLELVDLSGITFKQALLIGFGQSVAVIPGVSRSGATIVSGLALGLSRQAIVEFSFLLAIPTMLAASGYDLLKQNFNFSSQEIQFLALGFTISFIVALVVAKWLLQYIQKHNFTPFGVYRLILAVCLWWFIL